MGKKRKGFNQKRDPKVDNKSQTIPTEDEFPSLGGVTDPQPSTSTQPPTTVMPSASAKPMTKPVIQKTVRPEPKSESISDTTNIKPITSPTSDGGGGGDCGAGAGGDSSAQKSQSSDEKKSEDTKDLAKELKSKMLLSAPKQVHRPFPKRPKSITEGRDVVVRTNHFLLKVGSKQVFHYDIEIERAVRAVVKDPNVVDRDIEESIAMEKKTRFSRKIATKVNRKIFQQMIETYSQTRNQVFYGIHPVFDGQKNMFSSKLLSGTDGKERPSLRLAVDLNEDERVSQFYVNIRLTESKSSLDLSLLKSYHSGITCDDEVVKKCILFINTLLRHNASMDWVPIGQSIFNPRAPGQQIGPYISLSYGVYTSVRNLMAGPTLNVDRSAGAFYTENFTIDKIVGFIIKGQLTSVPALSTYQKRQVKRELEGLQVEATHIRYGQSYRKYRILGLSEKAAKEQTFDWIDKDMEGRDLPVVKISVEDYFRRKYRVNLKFPHLPCLMVGNANKPNYLPLEVCRIVSFQRLRRSMTNPERSEMTRISGQQSPRDRFIQSQEYVTAQFKNGEMATKNRPFLSEFEIDVSQDFLKVNSKVISPPVLKYLGNKSVTPASGEWEMYRSKAQFLRAASLKNWIVINISFSSITDAVINEFVTDLRRQAQEMGLQSTPQRLVARMPDYKPGTTFNGIKQRLKSLSTPTSKLEMILFITPKKTHNYSDEIYSEIKLLGDVENGLTTQCVNIDNIWPKKGDRNRWNTSYMRQLMLKINPKLGGTNVALMDSSSMPSVFKNKSLMIVGADVNHPAPADRVSNSISAMTGSYSSDYTQYYTTVSMQPKSRLEMINDLDKMVVQLLNNYNKMNKSFPKTIIFFRDGVSEGQFQHVIDNEYPLLEQAFRMISPQYKPKVTFIVVQKRHHTRFATENGTNVDPGTVVDNGVTHKTDFDFYLCSHSGRIGTSRAAHYYVLADENGFNTDDICKMTYYMCHTYQRCTKAVSIPAPVYYADLAAYRAKVHVTVKNAIEREVGSVLSGQSSGSGDSAQELHDSDPYIKVTESQKQKLYFC